MKNFEEQIILKHLYSQNENKDRYLFGDNIKHVRYISVGGPSTSWFSEKEKPVPTVKGQGGQGNMSKDGSVYSGTDYVEGDFTQAEFSSFLENHKDGKYIDGRTSIVTPEVMAEWAKGNRVHVKLTQMPPQRANLLMPLLASVMQLLGGLGGAGYNESLSQAIMSGGTAGEKGHKEGIGASLSAASSFVGRHGSSYSLNPFGGGTHIDVVAEFKILNQENKPDKAPDKMKTPPIPGYERTDNPKVDISDPHSLNNITKYEKGGTQAWFQENNELQGGQEYSGRFAKELVRLGITKLDGLDISQLQNSFNRGDVTERNKAIALMYIIANNNSTPPLDLSKPENLQKAIDLLPKDVQNSLKQALVPYRESGAAWMDPKKLESDTNTAFNNFMKGVVSTASVVSKDPKIEDIKKFATTNVTEMTDRGLTRTNEQSTRLQMKAHLDQIVGDLTDSLGIKPEDLKKENLMGFLTSKPPEGKGLTQDQAKLVVYLSDLKNNPDKIGEAMLFVGQYRSSAFNDVAHNFTDDQYIQAFAPMNLGDGKMTKAIGGPEIALAKSMEKILDANAGAKGFDKFKGNVLTLDIRVANANQDHYVSSVLAVGSAGEVFYDRSNVQHTLKDQISFSDGLGLKALDNPNLLKIAEKSGGLKGAPLEALKKALEVQPPLSVKDKIDLITQAIKDNKGSDRAVGKFLYDVNTSCNVELKDPKFGAKGIGETYGTDYSNLKDDEVESNLGISMRESMHIEKAKALAGIVNKLSDGLDPSKLSDKEKALLKSCNIDTTDSTSILNGVKAEFQKTKAILQNTIYGDKLVGDPQIQQLLGEIDVASKVIDNITSGLGKSSGSNQKNAAEYTQAIQSNVAFLTQKLSSGEYTPDTKIEYNGKEMTVKDATIALSKEYQSFLLKGFTLPPDSVAATTTQFTELFRKAGVADNKEVTEVLGLLAKAESRAPDSKINTPTGNGTGTIPSRDEIKAKIDSLKTAAPPPSDELMALLNKTLEEPTKQNFMALLGQMKTDGDKVTSGVLEVSKQMLQLAQVKKTDLGMSPVCKQVIDTFSNALGKGPDALKAARDSAEDMLQKTESITPGSGPDLTSVKPKVPITILPGTGKPDTTPVETVRPLINKPVSVLIEDAKKGSKDAIAELGNRIKDGDNDAFKGLKKLADDKVPGAAEELAKVQVNKNEPKTTMSFEDLKNAKDLTPAVQNALNELKNLVGKGDEKAGKDLTAIAAAHGVVVNNGNFDTSKADPIGKAAAELYLSGFKENGARKMSETKVKGAIEMFSFTGGSDVNKLGLKIKAEDLKTLGAEKILQMVNDVLPSDKKVTGVKEENGHVVFEPAKK